MRASLSLVFLIALFLPHITCYDNTEYSGRPSAVITLTDDNFDELTSTGTWIIEFYAPWCGHCKKLAPIFEEAANTLQGKVNLAKVDCTQEKALTKRFEIKSFPTLKFWRDGESRAYNGGRSVEALVAFGNEMSSPPITTVNSIIEIKHLRQNHPVIFILSTTGNTKSAEYKTFYASAHRLQGTHKFLMIDRTSVQAAEIQRELKFPDSPAIAVLSEGQDDFYTGPWTDAALRRWVEQYRLPLVTTISGSNFDDVTTTGKWIAFIVVDPQHEKVRALHDVIVDIAKQYKEQFVFATIDGNKYSKYVQQFAVEHVNAHPHILVLDFPDTYYKMTGDWSYQDLVKDPSRLHDFFADVVAGRVPATGTTAWYNPMRYVNKLERYLAGLTETQLIIGTVAVMLSFVGLLIAGCWCLDIGAVVDSDLPQVPYDGAINPQGGVQGQANAAPATAGASAPTTATPTTGTPTAPSESSFAAAPTVRQRGKKSAKAH